MEGVFLTPPKGKGAGWASVRGKSVGHRGTRALKGAWHRPHGSRTTPPPRRRLPHLGLQEPQGPRGAHLLPPERGSGLPTAPNPS